MAIDTATPAAEQATASTGHRRRFHGWHHHPGVRSGDGLTTGERYADMMRNSMGSWAFVFGSLVFLGLWMLANKTLVHFDVFPYILLNLVLSCIAALQGAILLIAAKRSDQVASELAQHDYDADVQSRELLEKLTTEFDILKQQHDDLHRHMDAVMVALKCHPEQVSS